jgi:hypothetical protein
MAGAVALTGFAVWELFDTYTTLAPSMSELRGTHRDDTGARQRLMDADMCVGGIAVLAGSAASYLSRSWIPLVLVTVALGWVSWYHHAALAGPTPRQIEEL